MRGPSRSLCLLSTLVLGAVVWGVLTTPGTASAAKARRRSADGVWAQARGGAEGGGRFSLNARALARILARAPSEAAGERVRRPVLTLPLPDGSYARFSIEKSPVLSADLQRRNPSIKTYRGQGVDDPSATARLGVTPLGFHALIISAKGTTLVDPAGGAYRSVATQSLAPSIFTCAADEEAAPAALFAASAANPSGDTLRTYRLAVSVTGEFSVANGAATIGRIAEMVNFANGIFEKEVAVRLLLVASPQVIFPNPATDPFTNGAVVDNVLLLQNQGVLDTMVGALNYDIGHVLTVGTGGGLAQIAGTCAPGLKGQGATSLTPAGDPFSAAMAFSHVIGHQLGAHHTFNGTTDDCGGTARNPATAYEPGSGSTLMSYAGRCGDPAPPGENVQTQPDAYFHTASFDEITAFLAAGGASCGTAPATGNSAPVVDAGPDYTIPRGTPFTLTASAVDDPADADTLTFCWEQFDLGAASPPPNVADGPLFRSWPPTVSPARTFPAMADLLSGAPTPWERLPEVDRTLTFRATARDNRAGGGGVDYDEVTLTVSGDPFAITAPAAGESLECGASAPLAWQVGGDPPLVQEVRALVSADRGATFAEAAMDDTGNGGAASLTVPKPEPQALGDAGAARIKLEAVGNVFFALSGALTIDDTLAPEVTAPANLDTVECTSPDGIGIDEFSLGDAEVADLCDDAPTLVNDAPSVFPLTVPTTTVTVTWTATDDRGNSDTGTQSVTVVDTTPPSIEDPQDITAECTSPDGTPVVVIAPGATDVCDDTVTVSSVPPVPPLFPLGTTTLLWSATDDSGNSASQAQDVTVVDRTPPVLTVTLTPAVLWPPNHKLHTITAAITVTDVCDDTPTVQLVSIVSDEPDNGKGDGNTAGDVAGASMGTDDREFQLRAERSGGGDGRVYTVTYRARDASGNMTTVAATVTVPHDMGR